MLTATKPSTLAHFTDMLDRAAKSRKSKYPTAQSSISEFETVLCGVGMVQVGSCCVEVEYSIEPACPEEPATMGDLGSPGYPASAEIHKITLTSDMQFVDAGDEEDAITLHAGFEITDFFPRTAMWYGKIADIKEEILGRLESGE